MKKILFSIAIVGCLNTVLSASNFGFGVSGSENGIDSFTLSIGNYFGVTQQHVRGVGRYVPREHMSVVYFLARQSHQNTSHIVNLRHQGLSWWDISLRLGLNPYILYQVRDSQSYGYQNDRRAHLQDSEIADFVNVRFISDYHHVKPQIVMQRHHQGERYEHIDSYYRKNNYNNNHSTSYDDRKTAREDKRYDRQQERREDKREYHDNKEDKREYRDNKEDKREYRNNKEDRHEHEDKREYRDREYYR